VNRWANQTGFEVASFCYMGQYPTYFMFNGFLFLLATGYEKLVSNLKPLNFLQGWIFVVLRKTEDPLEAEANQRSQLRARLQECGTIGFHCN